MIQAEQPTRRDVVTVGASAGGVAALIALCSALPEKFPAAVLVVLHIGNNSSVLPALLTSRANVRAVHAEQGQRIEAGTVYIAPPDQHMMLTDDGTIKLLRGPKEHHTRPAIDPLFRSAALTHGPRVIGVVLTGRLDDGTAGLQAIKNCGGLAIVQDPADAEHPSMPRSALQSVPVDHVVPLAAMAETLSHLVREPLSSRPQPAAEPGHERLLLEQAVSEGRGNTIHQLNAIGRPSTFPCPDCDGVLWEIDDSRPPRYRCHTGHAFSMRSLKETQAIATEDALWAALRALQSREELLHRLAEENRLAGLATEAAENDREAEGAKRHAGTLLHLLNELK